MRLAIARVYSLPVLTLAKKNSKAYLKPDAHCANERMFSKKSEIPYKHFISANYYTGEYNNRVGSYRVHLIIE